MSRLKERWRQLKERYEGLVAEYGAVAIGTYLVLFVGSLLAFWGAIELGFKPEGAATGAGTAVVAYGLTKAIQPFRILGTLALTPLVAALLRRTRRPEPTPERPPDP